MADRLKDTKKYFVVPLGDWKLWIGMKHAGEWTPAKIQVTL